MSLIPFGKWKDRDVRQMVALDLDYARWLMEQPWFARRQPGLYEEVEAAIEGRPSREELYVLMQQAAAQIEALQKQVQAAPKHDHRIDFSHEEVMRLIVLCHPDKHNGSELATMMTQKLLSLRQQVRKL